MIRLVLGLALVGAVVTPTEGEVVPWESFFAFAPERTEGLRVAICTHLGGYYVVTALGPGAPPLVKLWTYANSPGRLILHSAWYAYEPNFLGGVTVACSVAPLPPEQGGGGVLFIITGADAGGGPHGRVHIVYPAP